MKLFLSYCRQQYKKQRNVIVVIYFFVCFIFYLICGPKVINYLRGAENFNRIDLQDVASDRSFFSLRNMDNRYVKEHLTKISPGIADQVKNRRTIGIYYLYPVDESRYMVVFADAATWQDTEGLYYGDTEEIELQGGFVALDDEIKQYAFSYLHAVEPHIFYNMQPVEESLLPYMFVSNRIGKTPVYLVQTASYGFLFLLALIPLFFFIDSRLSSLKKTKESIAKLSEEEREEIDKEFKESKRYRHIRLGKKLLFYRFLLQHALIRYEDIVWMYIEKHTTDIIGTYSLFMYTKDGERIRVLLGREKKTAMKLADDIHHHNPGILLGYQAQLEDKYRISKEEFLKMIQELKGDTKEEDKTEDK